MTELLQRMLVGAGLRKAPDRAAAGGEIPTINDGNGNIPTIRVSRGAGLPAAQWTSHDFASRARAGYGRNSDVYACVSLIAQAGKQVRWWDGDAGTKAISAPETLLKSIGRNPNDWPASTRNDPRWIKAAANPRPSLELLDRAGGAAFIEQWLSYLLLSGNVYQELVRTGNRITMLYLDNPATVTAIENREAIHAADAVKQWRVARPYATTPRFLNPWRGPQNGDIVHSKLFNPTHAIYGMAPLEAAMLKVDWQNEGGTLAKRILQRGFSPGWIEAKDNTDWDEVQIAALKERLKHSKSAGEEIFLDGAIWHDLGFRLGDSGIVDQQLLNKRDIASVYHVDPALIGDTSSRTYATYAQSRLALYMEAVIPHLTVFRDDWNRTIGAELGSPLDFDKDAFDAITAARSEATDRVTKLWTSGLITQNEGRSDLEYGQVRGGDVFYAPASLVPLGPGEPETEETE